MYTCKCLKDVSFAEIAECFNLAFSDYALPVRLSEEQLRAHFAASGAEMEVSCGAFCGGRMVGFIINACSVYNGGCAAFDVGTGVVPAHRHNGVFTDLFAFAKQDLLKRGVKKYYLEVLQQNDRAIQAYKKQGFSILRGLHVLRFPSGAHTDAPAAERLALERFDAAGTRGCLCVRPSFEHSTGILRRNPGLYAVARRQSGPSLTAFCIFSKADGRIVQMGYSDLEELKAIVQELAAEFGGITIKNVDEAYPNVLEMLCSAGAVEAARQFEMVKDLSCSSR